MRWMAQPAGRRGAQEGGGALAQEGEGGTALPMQSSPGARSCLGIASTGRCSPLPARLRVCLRDRLLDCTVPTGPLLAQHGQGEAAVPRQPSLAKCCAPQARLPRAQRLAPRSRLPTIVHDGWRAALRL